MLTSAECQQRADQKRAEAELHSRNRQRLLTAAEGWLILAGIMGRLEASFSAPPNAGSGRVIIAHPSSPPLLSNLVFGTDKGLVAGWNMTGSV